MQTSSASESLGTSSASARQVADVETAAVLLFDALELTRRHFSYLAAALSLQVDGYRFPRGRVRRALRAPPSLPFANAHSTLIATFSRSFAWVDRSENLSSRLTQEDKPFSSTSTAHRYPFRSARFRLGQFVIARSPHSIR